MTLDNFHPLVLNVGWAHHESDWNWKEVRSPFSRLYYVCEGEASVKIGATIYPLTPGNLYLIPPFVCHSNICQGHFVHYYIHVYEDEMAGYESVFEKYIFPFEVKAEDLDEKLFQRLALINPSMRLPASNPEAYDNGHTLIQNIMHNKQRSASVKIESRGITYQIFSRFMQYAEPKLIENADRLGVAIKYIRTHLAENLNVEQLASMSSLSLDYFIRLFRKSMNMTPVQYINNKRIERAQLLLLTRELSVKAIAYALGYDDSSYFIRVFKHITGITPQEYRKSAQ